MTIEARTYNTIPGYFKIIDASLANCQIIFCELEGIEHRSSTTVPAAGVRGYNHSVGSGTVSFGSSNPFNTGAKAYFLIKY